MKAYYQKRQRELEAQISEIKAKALSDSHVREIQQLERELANFTEVLGRKEFTNETT